MVQRPWLSVKEFLTASKSYSKTEKCMQKKKHPFEKYEKGKTNIDVNGLGIAIS